MGNRRILLTGARAPCALHLARELAGAGHVVVLADSLTFPLARATRFASGFARLPPPRVDVAAYGQAVRAACARHGIDLIIPTCEEVFFLAAVRDGLGAGLLAPPFNLLKQVHDKFTFTGLAAGLGADAAETRLLRDEGAVAAFDGDPREWVFKPVWSRFGDRALIRPADLRGLRPVPVDPWVAQRYLPGEELCAYAMAYDGRMAALSAYRPLYRAGNGIGAGIMVEPVRDETIARFVEGFVRRTRWTGQVSFDFRRDGKGALHVLECNPRATTGVHFFATGDGLASALLDGTAATPGIYEPMGSGLAMLIYGLPWAIKTRTVADWRCDYGRMRSLMEASGDRSTLPFQGLALAEAAWRAVRNGTGLKAAATADIEWNGEVLERFPI